jgi:hypothetical protein
MCIVTGPGPGFLVAVVLAPFGALLLALLICDALTLAGRYRGSDADSVAYGSVAAIVALVAVFLTAI